MAQEKNAKGVTLRVNHSPWMNLQPLIVQTD